MDPVLEKLKLLKLELPPPPKSGGNYVPCQRYGQLLFLSGVISMKNGTVWTGCLGEDVSLEEGYLAARSCALTQLSVIRAATGSLASVAQIMTLNGYVRCLPSFSKPPQVINGASDLLVELYGDAGRHARAAVGVISLPAHAAVEVQMTVLLKGTDSFHPEKSQ